MDRADKILLFSGGVDSVIAYFYLNKPNLLLIDTKNRYAFAEINSIMNFIKNENIAMNIYTKEYKLNLVEFEQPNANIPARNLLFLTIGSQYADTVYLVAQRGEDSGPDRCGSFFKRVSQILTDCHQRKIICDQVFPGKTKQDMVTWYKENNYPIQYLLDAYSCYAGQERACSTCPACFRKFISLEFNGIDSSSVIDSNKLLRSPIAHEYLKKMTSHDNPYDRRRTKQTIKVLKECGLF